LGKKLLSLALAILFPVLIVAGSLAGLESFRTFADKREAKNAGKVINGRVVEGGVERVMENKLSNEPEVVILGNSLSNTDLQSPLLARKLGLARAQVQKFSIPNSMGAHWYAILKNRVYAAGHRPAVVVILSDLQSLLALAPRSEASHLNLAVHLTEEEQVIDKLLGSRYYYLERVRENRGKLRDKALAAARNAMVDLFVNHTLAPTDDRKIEAALSRVFDSKHTDMRLHTKVIPIFNSKSDHDLLPFDPAELPDPELSFIPHIAEMVQQNGGRLVVLRPPMSPQLPPGVGDIVLPETEQRVAPVLARYEATFLDLREVDMEGTGTHYQNVDHMNYEGARRFTEIFAEMLDDLGLVRRHRPSAELLKQISAANGAYEPLPLDVSFKSEPPAVPRADRPFVQGRGKLVYFPSEPFGYLNDLSTLEITPHSSRCSPLRVLEDGRPLPLHNVSCEEVTRHLKGRTCHTPDKLFFSTPDGSDPYTNDRDYTLALDRTRTCDGALWLYPGDRAKLVARQLDRAQLQRGAGAIRIAGAELGASGRGGDPVLQVRVRAGNQIRVDQPIDIEALPGRGVVLPLQPRIGPTPANVQVELINPSDRFVLLTSVRLLPDPPKGLDGEGEEGEGAELVEGSDLDEAAEEPVGG
jgi:hypothetical protein